MSGAIGKEKCEVSEGFDEDGPGKIDLYNVSRSSIVNSTLGTQDLPSDVAPSHFTIVGGWFAGAYGKLSR